jgi:hypothetical protein
MSPARRNRDPTVDIEVVGTTSGELRNTRLGKSGCL